MKIIGITGSSGAGKTEACKILQKRYDAEIIDADEVAKKLSKKGTLYLNSIVDSFGKEIVYKNGALNRKKLADMIYEDDKKREQLNQCTFDYIVQEIKARINNVNHKEMILIDAPLLYESGLDSICDMVIAIVSETDEQIQRICHRDGITKEMAIKRLNAQADNQFFEEMTDIQIQNNGTLEQLKETLQKIKI
ncbi:MAG: dephospho-CoA kinase [Clostridia bacterium]